MSSSDRWDRYLAGEIDTPYAPSNVVPITDAESAHIAELLEWFDRLGAGFNLQPSARSHDVVVYRRKSFDDAQVERDIRREHWQTDDGWLTEPLSNGGEL